MSEEQEVLLTAEGFKKLEEKLEHLKTVRRKEVAARIKQAIDFGDLSENSEYDDAKNEQAFIEGSIVELENKLARAKIIEEEVETKKVVMGCTVELEDIEFGETMTYTLVGSMEADPMEFKISNESPVGSAILGQTVGSVVDVKAPAGNIKYKIIDIKK
ncbi:MAG: transcription elongation factor GreA [Firmicutes bacterium]|jgi:transcription elongation factor GreA|nr:transcription elongation factor GreA [Bacillota bacterium]